MEDFLSACLEEKREGLQMSLQTFIEGHIGAYVELCFPLKTIEARTQLVTLSRNGLGRAERVVGCISALERQAANLLPSARFSMRAAKKAPDKPGKKYARRQTCW